MLFLIMVRWFNIPNLRNEPSSFRSPALNKRSDGPENTLKSLTSQHLHSHHSSLGSLRVPQPPLQLPVRQCHFLVPNPKHCHFFLAPHHHWSRPRRRHSPVSDVHCSVGVYSRHLETS